MDERGPATRTRRAWRIGGRGHSALAVRLVWVILGRREPLSRRRKSGRNGVHAHRDGKRGRRRAERTCHGVLEEHLLSSARTKRLELARRVNESHLRRTHRHKKNTRARNANNTLTHKLTRPARTMLRCRLPRGRPVEKPGTTGPRAEDR